MIASASARFSIREGKQLTARFFAHVRRHTIGYLALFVALGGVAFAATQAPRNSVTSRAIKNGQVRTSDLATNAVSAAKVKDSAIGTAELASGAVDAAKIAPGAIGTAELASGAVNAAKIAPGAVSGVVARAVATADTQTLGGTFVSIPFGGSNAWTQDAFETDVLYGEVTVTRPASCGGSEAGVVLQPFVTTTYAKSTQKYPWIDLVPGQVTVPVFLDHNFLVEPGTDTIRGIQLFADDDCTGPGERFTINGAKIVVFGMR